MALTAVLLFAILNADPASQETGRAAPVPTAKESESGHRYPLRVVSVLREDDLESSEEVEPRTLELLGMAVREKTIFAVNVYSYALFVDRDFVREDLAQWRGGDRGKIEKDERLFARLLEQNATKELRLRFCRDVESDDVVEAFEESLEPRLLARRRDAAGTKDQKLRELATFRGFFTLDELKEGKEIRFTWHPDGTLSTIVDGERKPDIVSKDLCWALFDVYLGKDPISKSGRKRLVRGLAK